MFFYSITEYTVKINGIKTPSVKYLTEGISFNALDLEGTAHGGGNCVCGDGAIIARCGLLLELFGSLFDDGGIVDHIDNGCSHDLTCVQKTLMTDGRFGGADVLPRMTGAARCKANGADLRGGGLPAYIADIGGTGAGDPAGIVGDKEIVEGTGTVLSLFDNQIHDLVVVALAGAGEPGLGVGLCKLVA